MPFKEYYEKHKGDLMKRQPEERKKEHIKNPRWAGVMNPGVKKLVPQAAGQKAAVGRLGGGLIKPIVASGGGAMKEKPLAPPRAISGGGSKMLGGLLGRMRGRRGR